MFGNPSLNTRIAVGKTLGALFGLAGFIYLTVYPVGDESLLRWGILLWYTTLGEEGALLRRFVGQRRKVGTAGVVELEQQLVGIAQE